eukprot:scaffold1490_cov162-Ochromonas_danica.AAC.36
MMAPDTTTTLSRLWNSIHGTHPFADPTVRWTPVEHSINQPKGRQAGLVIHDREIIPFVASHRLRVVLRYNRNNIPNPGLLDSRVEKGCTEVVGGRQILCMNLIASSPRHPVASRLKRGTNRLRQVKCSTMRQVKDVALRSNNQTDISPIDG